MVVSAFPGTGKTYLCNTREGFIDSDSSSFSWRGKERHPDWPKNYIEHIENNLDKTILVSTHKEVRNALVEAQIPFILCYPHIDLKEEYLTRYKNRGSSEAFINLLSDNWEKWITELNSAACFLRIVLAEGQYLSDVL